MENFAAHSVLPSPTPKSDASDFGVGEGCTVLVARLVRLHGAPSRRCAITSSYERSFINCRSFFEQQLTKMQAPA